MRIPDININPIDPQALTGINPDALSSSANVMQQGLGQLSNLAIGRQEQEREQTVSAQMRAIQAKYEADLAKNNAIWTDSKGTASVQSAFANAISDVGQTLNKVYEAAEAKSAKLKEKEQARLDKMYKLEAGIKFQEELAYKSAELQTKAGADGSQYLPQFMDWYNKRVPEYLASAPSDQARTDLFYSLEKERLQQVEHSLKFEDNRRKELMGRQAENVYSSLVKQSYQSPEQMENLKAQAVAVSDELVKMGLPEPIVYDKLKATLDQITETSYNVKLSNGQAAEVMADITNNPEIDKLGTAAYLRINNNTASAFEAHVKDQQKQMIKEQHMTKVLAGLPLSANNSDDEKAFNTYYQESTKGYRDPKTKTLTGDPTTVALALGAVLQTNKSFLPEDFKNEVVGYILSGNSDQKKIGAALVAELDRVNGTRHLLNNLPKDVVAEGLAITRAIVAGKPIDQAMEEARMLVHTPRNDLTQSRKDNISRVLPDKDIDAKIQQVYGVAGTAFMSGVSDASAAKYQYKDEFSLVYLTTGDADMAHKMAKVRVAQDFAVSKVNGDSELMRHAPERLFPNTNQSKIREFFDTKLAELNPDGTKQFKIVADNLTVKANTYGSYVVYEFDESGWQPVRDENGGFKRLQYTDGIDDDTLESVEKLLTMKDNYAKMNNEYKDLTRKVVEAVQSSGREGVGNIRNKYLKVWDD